MFGGSVVELDPFVFVRFVKSASFVEAPDFPAEIPESMEAVEKLSFGASSVVVSTVPEMFFEGFPFL